MQARYTRFGRRYRVPSIVEISEQLRSGDIPGHVRKSWAQFGSYRARPKADWPKIHREITPAIRKFPSDGVFGSGARRARAHGWW